MPGSDPVDGLDGRSLAPALAGAALDAADVVAEYLAEGVSAPAVMLRRGRHKYVWCAGDPEQLYDLEADPHELRNLAPAEPRALRASSTPRCARRWDLGALRDAVLRSQDERRLVARALGAGRRERLELRAAAGRRLRAGRRRPLRGAAPAAPRRPDRGSGGEPGGLHHLRGDRRGRHSPPLATASRSRRRRSPTSAIDAARAGAAVVHIHVRDPATGRGSRDVALYREVVERMRAADVDAVLNLTAGMGGDLVLGGVDAPLPLDAAGTDMVGAEERLAHVAELRPEICTLDCGSMNFAAGGDYVMVNTPGDAARDGRADPGARRAPRARGLRHRPPRDGRAT